MDCSCPLNPTPLTLCTLPLEILLHIQSYLPTHAAALFVLTNKTIWVMLGANAILSLRGEHRKITETRKFLLILERDLPGYYACRECLVFHLMDDLPSNSNNVTQTAPTKLCVKHDMLAEKRLFNSEHVHYLDLRNAMQTSNPTAQLAALQSLNVRTGNATVEFALQSNKILMRGQYFIKCFIGDPSDIFELELLLKVYVCDHVMQLGIDLEKLAHCKPYRLQRNSLCQSCAKECWCPLCPTEFQGHTVFLNEAEYLFVITRWLDLGSCTSPNEPYYRSHMAVGSAQWIHESLHPLVVYEPGSIKAAFESECRDQGLRLYKDAAEQFAYTFVRD